MMAGLFPPTCELFPVAVHRRTNCIRRPVLPGSSTKGIPGLRTPPSLRPTSPALDFTTVRLGGVVFAVMGHRGVQDAARYDHCPWLD